MEMEKLYRRLEMAGGKLGQLLGCRTELFVRGTQQTTVEIISTSKQNRRGG